MQSSFSDLEYAAKKKQTRRDRFLVEIEAITPWASLMNVLAPYYIHPVISRRLGTA
jgi:IS5 family transposase